MGYAACMNQEALNDGYYQIVTIDRRLLANIIHVFLLIQLDLCFGHHDVSVPCETQNFNEGLVPVFTFTTLLYLFMDCHGHWP
jgi:hypothetical protein